MVMVAKIVNKMDGTKNNPIFSKYSRSSINEYRHHVSFKILQLYFPYFRKSKPLIYVICTLIMIKNDYFYYKECSVILLL